MTHKLTPGQPAIIKAGEYNAGIEAGQWYSQQRQLGSGASIVPGGISPCVIKVRNEFNGDLNAGSVVEIGASLLTTFTQRQIWLSAAKRAGDGVCGVLLQPIKYQKMGPCQISGVCLAPVNIIDADNTHARVEVGSSVFKGDFGGYARILYKPSGTGVKDCVVLLGHHQSIIRKAVSTSTITANGSGTANVEIAGSVVGSVTIYYDHMTGGGNIASSSDLFIQYFHDQDKWIVIGAECGA